jgi:hypothetical protein
LQLWSGRGLAGARPGDHNGDLNVPSAGLRVA